MTLTPLATILARRRRDGADVHFDVPDDWLQGRTSFGGLISVFAVQAMRDVAGGAWPAQASLRALQTNFIAPVEAGAVAVGVTVLREGRNVRQVQAVVKQRGEMTALMVGVFGSDRESSLAPLRPRRPPARRSPDESVHSPFRAGTRPNFTAHFDMRWSEGAPPYTSGEGSAASLHLRSLDTDAATLPAELMTVLMADVSPTPLITQLSAPAPASSVSWALELRPLDAAEDLAGWWRADNRAIAASGGYVNQQSLLWAPSGELAGLAYQVVSVYA